MPDTITLGALVRRNLAAVLTALGGVGALGGAIGVVTGSRFEGGGDRLDRLEAAFVERLGDVDVKGTEQRVATLEQVLSRELRVLIALTCNNPSTSNEMFDLLDCRTRLDRVGVDPPRNRR